MLRQIAQRGMLAVSTRSVSSLAVSGGSVLRRNTVLNSLPAMQRVIMRCNSTSSGGGDKPNSNNDNTDSASRATDEKDTTPTEKANEAPASEGGAENEKQRTSLRKFEEDEYDDWEPKTAKEKVGYYSQLAFMLGLLGLAAGCVYVFIKEVNPFGRSPQAIFDSAVDRLVIKDEILAITGPGPRAYGRDYGAQSEGRRNIVDSRTYKEERDGSNRTRVRFNIKGSKGRVMVWAEVSDKMPTEEYVYLIAQDMRTGRILTIEDNRSRLETEMSMNSIGSGGEGSGAEAKNALLKLLGANNSK